jgi:hypothetical protein
LLIFSLGSTLCANSAQAVLVILNVRVLGRVQSYCDDSCIEGDRTALSQRPELLGDEPRGQSSIGRILQSTVGVVIQALELSANQLPWRVSLPKYCNFVLY